ncbi:uncharacterized protein LOC115700272 [Cannabis sativa]|uniref:uncharacterized protein LOC115700272 n=1 Tax=Cannabis sativa TaxID=3483 RepID=UPI0029CA512C|nr:uncharacterized protein LOC115700272 [Cannabis sativa]
MGGIPGGELHVGKFFRDKEYLKMVVGLYAMKKGFDYFVRKSGTTIWYITCKDTDCGWRLRAKKNVFSNMFNVTTFRGKDNCQASPLIVAHLIKDKFATNGSDHLASNIRKDMQKDYMIQISYKKAWRCREKALHLVRGTPEGSYSKLPYYMHILQLRNPSSIMNFVVKDGRFKYCFFLLGPCRRGFRFCRPVVCVDGSFLKTRYGGKMLCAVALDAGNHIFRIDFVVVDSKNHNSWTYSTRKLKEAIADVEKLAFLSDRHQNIVHALETVFPDAHYGACYHHIIMNVNHKFKTDVLTNYIYTSAYKYSKSEFHREFENIRAMNVAIAQYLEEIGFDKWVRSYFLGVHYNVMTSTWAESFNNTTKNARGFLITAVVAFPRSKVQQ